MNFPANSKDFPVKIMQYDESRGVTVTIYDLKNKDKQPIRLTSDEFFQNTGAESQIDDFTALPIKFLMKDQESKLKLSDY